jgi:hypothetical protein
MLGGAKIPYRLRHFILKNDHFTKTGSGQTQGKHPTRDAFFAGSEFPDVCMDGIARHKKNYMNYSSFFRDAGMGTLPNFAMVLPNGSRSGKKT